MLCLFFAASGAGFAQFAAVKGKITDPQGAPIPYVNVYVQSQSRGAVSDEEGQYKLILAPGSNILLEITHSGYKKVRQNIFLEADEILELNFSLEYNEIGEVVVADDRIHDGNMKPIPLKGIKVNPSVQQGIESMLVSGMGVRINNELSSNYSVRGGSYDENLVYVNGIQVYRPFLARSGEQEGLSFPNPDMVQTINFSAGGFDARYGDKMSSVLDIQYKKPTEFEGAVSASLLGGAATIGTASKKQKFTQITGFRYQTNQYLLGSLDTQGDYQPNFADLQSYWTYDLNSKWELSFLGNYSRNDYRFVPQTRQTQFGSINEALRFTVYFEGEERVSYETWFGALSANFQSDNNTLLKFTGSAYRTLEEEHFDVMGQYFLDELERDFGNDQFADVVRNRGIGTYLNHARNSLNATVYSVSHKGYKQIDNKYLEWGLTYNHEIIEDNIREWELIDSAGYSVPIQPLDQIVLQEFIHSRNNLGTDRASAFVQNRWDWLSDNETVWSATFGVRGSYWSYTDEALVSPRASIAFQPKWEKKINDSTTVTRNVIFRFSTGYYYQPPFYREFRRLDGSLNPDIRAQRAIHFVLGSEVNFSLWQRPFKFLAEAYYKKLDFLVPYEIDNMRLRYYAENNATGYAAGLDLKIHGEFVKGMESWANLSFLKTEEDILDDYYYDYFNAAGEEIIAGYTADAVAVDSVQHEPGYIPRPTDQLVYFNMFFQDEMPSWPQYKVHVNFIFGTGLPFGPPSYERYKDINRFRAYKRMDIGFSRDFIDKDKTYKGLFAHLNSAVVSLEVWNLLGISNTHSYTWIKESGGRLYGIPNYLTSRRINLKLAVTF